jgi:hypothetical protein
MAAKEDLMEAFGTTDEEKICLEILAKGELQVRNRLALGLLGQVADRVHRYNTHLRLKGLSCRLACALRVHSRGLKGAVHRFRRLASS